VSLPDINRRSAKGVTFFAISLSICWTHFSRFDPLLTGDFAHYFEIFNAGALTDIPPYFRFRVLTPLLARLVPDFGVGGVFGLEANEGIAMRFGAVNILALGCTGLLLDWYLKLLSFDPRSSFIGVLMFYLTFGILNFAGLPYPDAVGYLLIIAGTIALLKEKFLIYSACLLIGLFNKNTILFLPLFGFFQFFGRRRELISTLVYAVPAIVAFFIFKVRHVSGDMNEAVNVPYFLANYGQGIRSDFARKSILGLFSISTLIPFVVLGWSKTSVLSAMLSIGRLKVLLVLILATPILLGIGSWERHWMLAFPVFIPIALVGIDRLLYEKAPA
jgi:hypothetical protein